MEPAGHIFDTISESLQKGSAFCKDLATDDELEDLDQGQENQAREFRLLKRS